MIDPNFHSVSGLRTPAFDSPTDERLDRARESDSMAELSLAQTKAELSHSTRQMVCVRLENPPNPEEEPPAAIITDGACEFDRPEDRVHNDPDRSVHG